MSNLKQKIRREEPKLEPDNEIEFWLEWGEGKVRLWGCGVCKDFDTGALVPNKQQILLTIFDNGNVSKPPHCLVGLNQIGQSPANAKLLETAEWVINTLDVNITPSLALDVLKAAVEKAENLGSNAQ